ncbi:XdhC family protein [Pseudohalioglobus lutimaris]|uniref:XdhC family protein n=1 Tax=Pseudohalioglobus lutimaris TaxID=1737061 RepID=A0A2N5X5W9_9GAMM|nr:XdhC family protein [Pseudohalioglobus lutimaris]PLW69879.1 hypothetical protein C0039_04920 [Pseudohalioglobus lutimaris]
MRALDHNLLQRLQTWIDRGEQPWLCTIVKTVGSSPRPDGSMLAALATGEQFGSVSGGCVEEDLLEKLSRRGLADELPELIEYGVSAEENERLGLPCGGKLILMVQRLDEGDLKWIKASLTAIDKRYCVKRRVSLTTGKTQLIRVEYYEPLEISNSHLEQCFGPRMRMMLVGAGQLAQTLSELALAMDYEVLVTDPRQSFLNQWAGPNVELIQGMPDDVIRERECDRHTLIITLTHDPRIDDMALMEALSTDAWYVGALGSQKTTENRLVRLKELGLSTEQVSRLHAPVGLSIGSKTPIEISVAVMAELIQMRYRPTDS